MLKNSVINKKVYLSLNLKKFNEMKDKSLILFLPRYLLTLRKIVILNDKRIENHSLKNWYGRNKLKTLLTVDCFIFIDLNTILTNIFSKYIIFTRRI